MNKNDVAGTLQTAAQRAIAASNDRVLENVIRKTIEELKEHLKQHEK